MKLESDAPVLVLQCRECLLDNQALLICRNLQADVFVGMELESLWTEWVVKLSSRSLTR